MKLFSSELGHNYDSYTFGYAHYCEKEIGDALTTIYRSGYLPYSGSPDVKNIFYMARSARVVLAHYELTSENRRIAKKFDGLFEKTRVPFSNFAITEEFLDFCLQYFIARHGQHTMPKERLLHILSMGLITHTTIYRSASAVVAYVLEVADGPMKHYWYSFYDPVYAQQSLGIWLMLDGIRDAKVAGMSHYYIGTVYGEKALYKTNFEALEWWDGQAWNTHIKLLKERGRTDETRAIAHADVWKSGLQKFS